MVGDFRKRTIWLACLMLVLSTTFALGQGIVTGSIAGTAVDPQKAVVVGAKVTAKNTATGVEFKSTTNGQGYFSIRSVPLGTYRVTLEAPNFKRLDVDGVTVSTGETNDLGALTLALGATAETVTVEGAAPLIETSTAQGSGTFTSAQTQNLPMNGGFDQLALLLPGVVSAGGTGFSNNNGAQFAVNGQRDRSNNFQIDGQYNNDNSVAGPAIFLSNQDALQEVQVVTNNFGAEYGRNSGSVVNYVTKSGTNNFHGSAFEYFTGNWADALDQNEKSPLLGFCAPGENPATTGCTPPVVPRYTENRWGGTLGGPIIPNKMFFFTSFTQDTVKVSGEEFDSGKTVTPTPAGIATLGSCFPGNAAVNLLKTMGPFTYTTSNPVAINTADYTVTGCATPVQFGGVRIALPGIANDYEAVGRVDIAVTPKDQFFARYLFQQELDTGALGGGAGGGSSLWGGSVSNVPDRGQQIALDWTRNMTTHLVNQVRFSYERTALLFQQGSAPQCTALAGGLCPPTIEINGTVAPGAGNINFGYGNNLPQGRSVFNTQFQDNASWQHGRHLLKFGGEYVRQRSPSIFLPNFEGTFIFSSFANFIGDTGTLNLTNGNLNNIYKEQDTALYAADDWRIRDNLTLNLGVRWEYFQQAINLLARDSFLQQTGPDPFWSTLLPLSVTTVPNIPNVYHNFAPRVGFAWTPHMFESILGHDKTVIRGGFSMAYDPAFYNMFLNVATSAPVVNAGTVAGCTGCLPSEPTANSVRAADLGLIPIGGNPGARNNTRVASNFHNPYAEEWTLGIQRELTSKVAAEARYVGSHTVGEFQTLDGNPSLAPLLAFIAANPTAPDPIPSGVTPCATPGAPGFASDRVNCNFTNLRVRANTSWSNYNALQASLKFTAWHGFTSSVSYTYSKTIDNASEIFGSPNAGAGAAAAQDPFSISSAEKGLSLLDYPNTLSIAWQYEVPYHGAKTGLMGTLLGGWAVAGTYKYLSGQVWQPLEFPGDSPYCPGNVFDAAFFSGVTSNCRPFMSNPAAPVDTVGQCTVPTAADCGLINFFTGAPTTFSAVRIIYNDANSAAFFKTPYGTMGRNPVGFRGTPVNTVNFNLVKNNRITEKLNMRLEANVLNLFNHPFYGQPDAYIDDGSFAVGSSYGNTYFNSAGGGSPPFGTNASANAVNQGLANRRIILGAHIIF